MFLKFPLNLKEKGVSNLRGRERVRQCILPGGGRSFALQWKREKIRIRRSLNSRKWRAVSGHLAQDTCTDRERFHGHRDNTANLAEP
jgi:hypothetical protein